MTKQLLVSLLSLLLLLDASSAFTPSGGSGVGGHPSGDRAAKKAKTVKIQPSSSWSPLVVASTTSGASTPSASSRTTAPFSEDEARLVLEQAKEYAYDDDRLGTLEEAQFLLREMIHLQSGCVTGTLVGKDLCDDQAGAADVVAHLRTKVGSLERLERAKHPHSSPPSSSVVPMIATELALGAMLVVVAIFWTITDMSLQQGEDFVAPHNIHDWWAAFTQMGYLSFL